MDYCNHPNYLIQCRAELTILIQPITKVAPWSGQAQFLESVEVKGHMHIK